MKMNNTKLTLAVIVTLAATAAAATASNLQWGGVSSQTWSDGNAWNSFPTSPYGAAPGAGDVLYFEDQLFFTGYTNAALKINNVVDTSTAVAAINYSALSAGGSNHFYTTLIPAGVNLTVGGVGASAAVISVGDVYNSGSWNYYPNTYTNYSAMVGGGTLNLTDSASEISVGTYQRATLDLSGLSNVVANLNQVWVGVQPSLTYPAPYYGPAGWLLLGATNSITTTPNLTAPGVVIGSLALNYEGYPSDLLLGGNNTVNSDGILVGGYRSGSSVAAYLMFGNSYSNSATASTFKLRGSDGVSAAAVFSIGDMTASWQGYNLIPNSSSQTAYYAAGTADFSGGIVDMLINNLYVGRACVGGTNNVTSYGQGTFIAERGTITVTNAYLGFKPTSTNSSYVSSSTLILKSNVTMNVVNDLSLYYRTNGSTSGASTLMVSNLALLNVGGNITCTDTIGSTVTAHAVVLGGGVINMSGYGSVTAPNLLGFGTIANAKSITVTNALSMKNDTLTGIGTLNLSSNLVVGPAVKLTFSTGASTTPGGVVSDYLNVGGNVAFNNNPVTLLFTAPPAAGDYHLIDYSGTASGSLVFPSSGFPRGGLTFHQPSAGWAGFTAPAPSAASLVWNGTVTNKWTATNSATAFSTNWLNTSTLALDKFYPFDNVVITNGVGITTNVTLDGTIYAPNVTVAGNTNIFLVTAAGKLTACSTFNVNLNPTNTLVFAAGGSSTYPSDFTGPINVNSGTLKFGTGYALTAGINQGVNVAAGAAFDMNGSSFPYYIKQVTIAGTGVNTNGVMYTSSANAISYMTNLSLSADSTIGLWLGNYKIGMTYTLASTISSPLNLNGNTLSLLGTNVFLLQWANVGNGSINVYPGGNLWVYNCNISGTGSINLPNGSTLSLWDSSGYNSSTLGSISKSLTISNAVIQNNNSQAFYGTTIPDSFTGPVNLQGAMTLIPTYQPMAFSGVISGPGSVVKSGTNNVTLTAAETYTGPTTVNQGVITLSGSGSLASSNVTVAAGALLDVTGLGGGYTTAAGQTVEVDGTANGNLIAGAYGTIQGLGSDAGSLTLAPGGTLAIGTFSTGGTLTVTNNLVINGGTNTFKWGGPDDMIAVGGNLSITAPVVVKINPVGPLTGRHILYQYAGSSSGVTPDNFIFQSSRPLTYTLDTSVAGQVAVTISGSVTLNWDGGAPGAPTAWDANTTTNWLNLGSLDKFLTGDSVQFDDTGATNLVSLPTSVAAGAITFANSTMPYTLVGTGGITAGSLTTAGGGSVTFSNVGNTTLTGSGLALNGGTLTLAQPNNATLTAKISGGGLAKAGTNTLTMVGSDSSGFNGSFAINGGTVKLGSANVLGFTTTTIANGATLDVNGLTSTNATIATAGAGTDGNGAINNRSALVQTNALGGITFNGDTTLGASGARWDVAPGGAGLQGNGHKLTKVTANDIWIRTLTDTALGDIDVQAGKLVFAGNGTLLGDVTASILVRTNAALGFAGGIQDLGSKSVTVAPGGYLYSLGYSNQFNGNIVLSNGLVQSESLAQLTLGGNLSGPAQFLMQGVTSNASGTVTLAGTNTYTGGTLLNDGQLNFANSAAIPSNTNVVMNGRLAYNASGGNCFLGLLTNVVSPPSAGLVMILTNYSSLVAGAATVTGDGATWSGPITIIGTNAQCSATFASGYGGLIIASNINGSAFRGDSTIANGGIKISGDNTLVSDPDLGGVGVRFNKPLILNSTVACGNTGLGGSPGMTKMVLASSGNSWTNPIYWNRGVIQIGADNALPPTAPVTVGTLISGADHRVILDLNGHNQTLSNWTETFVGNDPVWMGNSSTNANSVLTFAGGATTNKWTSYILDSFDTNAVIQKQTSLNVTAGYLILLANPFGDPGPNSSVFLSGPPPYPIAVTYSGATTISGGTLELDRYIANSDVTVSGTGTLRGTGPLGGSLTVQPGGTVSPGTNQLSALVVSNNVTFAAGSTAKFRVNVNANTADTLVATGNLSYGSGLMLVVTNVGSQAITNGTILSLFTAASYTAGTVAVTPPVPAPGLVWDTSYLAVDGTLRVAPVNTTAPTLTSSKTGGNLTLAWPADHAGWRLQVQTNSLATGINTNWVTVPASTNVTSVTLPIAGAPTVFYRLVYP